MAKMKLPDKLNGISGEAVKAKTGKSWAEWIAVLDKADAQKMTHQQIVAYLHTVHGVGGWWQQMVTGGYEKARKGRAKGEMPDGFQVSANKTLPISAAAAFKHWNDAKARARWLKDDELTITTKTANKSIRARWGESRVSVYFWPKGETKTQIAIEHSQLKNARAAARVKKFWAEALGKLKALIDG
ncbi:MAG: DUF4287 domain-containing protein [Anaerolineales bacterium]